MSTKKDNFQLSDKKLMRLAISLAENQKYFTGTNPSVGCVITIVITHPTEGFVPVKYF